LTKSFRFRSLHVPFTAQLKRVRVFERIELAFARLKADDGSNVKTATECGVSSATHFEQAFKNIRTTNRVTADHRNTKRTLKTSRPNQKNDLKKLCKSGIDIYPPIPQNSRNPSRRGGYN
jgi:hypothetical protein